MSQKQQPERVRGLTAIDGAMALVVLLLIVQIWLLSATLETYLEGHQETALPAAIASVPGSTLPKKHRSISASKRR